MTKIEREYLDWVIWFSNDDRDYILNGDVNVPDIETLDDIYFSYNQAKQQKTRNDCTLYWPITAVSNLMNHKFSDEEIMEIVALSRERGKTDDAGRWIQMWVKAVVDRWNSKKDKKLMYFATDKRSDFYYDAMDKKHFVVIGISGNAALTKETLTGELKSDKLTGAKTYWHCLCNTNGGDGYKKAVDNYNTNDLRGYNETKEPNPLGNEYKVYMNVYKGNIYQASGFVILPKPDDKEEIKRLNDFKDLIIKSILSNKEEWHRLSQLSSLTNDKYYKAVLADAQWYLNRVNNEHRAKLDTIITMLSLDKKDFEYLK